MGQVAALQAVWVSHRHADHALGLGAVLAARPANAPPLLVVGPSEVGRWLDTWQGLHGKQDLDQSGSSLKADHPVAPPVAIFMHCKDFHQAGLSYQVKLQCFMLVFAIHMQCMVHSYCRQCHYT